MRYDVNWKLKLPVKASAVESVCKQFVGSRFKLSGCRYPKAGTNSLLAVRCCLENMR